MNELEKQIENQIFDKTGIHSKVKCYLDGVDFHYTVFVIVAKTSPVKTINEEIVIEYLEEVLSALSEDFSLLSEKLALDKNNRV